MKQFVTTGVLVFCLCMVPSVAPLPIPFSFIMGETKGEEPNIDKPLVVELWPGKTPDETADIGAETTRMSPKLDKKQVEVTEPTKMVTNVTKPTITIYRPAKEKDTGTAVLICPG